MEAPFRVIDADGHVTETDSLWNLWASRLPKEYRAAAPRWYSHEDGGRYWIVEGKVWPGPLDRVSRFSKPPGMWGGREGEQDPRKRIPDMDSMGLDVAVIFCSTMIHVPAIVEDPGLAAAVSRVYNDWLSDYCSTNPGRLKGIAMVPVQDPTEAAKELRRAVEKLGLVGALFPPFYGDKMLDHKDFYAIYREAQDLGVPICVHTNTSINPGRHLFDNFLLRHAFSSVPLMMSLGSVVVGGVLDTFPSLRFAFLEAGGGWVPYVMERIQDRANILPNNVAKLEHAPADYIRGEQLFYSVEPHELTAPMAAAVVGEDRFVMGSDYAHWDGTAPESVRTVMKRQDLSDGLKKKILSDNPARLYNL